MMARKSNPCATLLPAREPRASSTDARGDHTHGVRKHGPVHTKLSDELREYLRDQPRLVLIGVNGVARPFFHLPFHAGSNARD